MTVIDSEDGEECDLQAPRAGSCWTQTLMPDWVTRRMRVQSNLASRNMRRVLSNAPHAYLAFVLAIHVTVWPMALASLNLIQPAHVMRVAERSFRVMPQHFKHARFRLHTV